MAITTSSDVANAVNTELLGAHVLQEQRPKNVMLQFCNLYDLKNRAPTLTLNSIADPGPATAETEGTAVSTIVSFGYDTKVQLSPTEAAMQMGQITDDARELEGMYDSIVALVNSGNQQHMLDVFGPKLMILMRSVYQKAEKDAFTVLDSASQSVGTSGAVFTLANISESIYLLDAGENEDDDYVGCYDQRQIKNLRDEMAVTSGGLQGAVHHRDNVDHYAGRANGYKFPILGVPLFQIGASTRVLKNASDVDVLGGMFIPGYGDPELSGDGKYGAVAFAQSRNPQVEVGRVIRSRATDLKADWKYAVGERRDSMVVKAITKTAA